MAVLTGWCWVAAAMLLASIAVHASTFLGIDPMEVWPGVMFIHVAILPPCIAALWYAVKGGGNRRARIGPRPGSIVGSVGDRA